MTKKRRTAAKWRAGWASAKGTRTRVPYAHTRTGLWSTWGRVHTCDVDSCKRETVCTGGGVAPRHAGAATPTAIHTPVAWTGDISWRSWEKPTPPVAFHLSPLCQQRAPRISGSLKRIRGGRDLGDKMWKLGKVGDRKLTGEDPDPENSKNSETLWICRGCPSDCNAIFLCCPNSLGGVKLTPENSAIFRFCVITREL